MFDLVHAVNKYVGLPWNPNGFDCWEFVRAVYHDAYGIMLPTFGGIYKEPQQARELFQQGQLGPDWTHHPFPHNGDVVLMGRRDYPHHAGVYLEAGSKIAHNSENVGVVVNRISALQASGWGFIRYYGHKDKP